MKFVLDTSAILCREDNYLEGETYIPQAVAHEIKRDSEKDKLYLLQARGLMIRNPERGALDDVVSAAERTGDLLRLSQTDMEVVGLALQLGAIIISDDYSIQNVAKELGLEYFGVAQEVIKEKFQWTCRCAGCGRYYEKKMDDCPICGAEVKVKRKKKKDE